MSITLLGALSALGEPRYRAELYRAWETANSAGLSHAAALEALGTSGSRRTEDARRYLLVGLQQGKSLTSLMRARPSLFDALEVAVLTAGEENDTLPHSLQLLTDLYSREFKRANSIRLLMGYPIFIGVALSFAAALPALHRGWRPYLVMIGVLLAALLLLGGLVIAVIAGVMLSGTAMSRERFARVLAVTLAAGIPVGRAVRLSVDASRNAGLRAHLVARSERDLATTPLAKIFEGCREVPPAMLTQMSIADVTGDYIHTMRRHADQLEEK
jgi:type II secretory pathway component PulF